MRGQRQQLVIEAILKKLTSVGSVTKVGNIIDDINGQFVTNLTFDDMLSFYKYGSDSEIEKLQIQGDDCYMEKGTIHVANPLVAAERITTIQIKRISKGYKRSSYSSWITCIYKTDSDSKKQVQKTKESKSENTSERESSNNEMKNKNSNEDTETSSNDNE